MNQNYQYQPYGRLNETEDNIPQGQPVESQNIQMARMSQTPQQPISIPQQIPVQQTYPQNIPQQYNYPPLPQGQLSSPPQMYASNPAPVNPYSQMGQSQVQVQNVAPVQQNFAMLPIVNHPTSRHPQQLYCANCKQYTTTKVALKNGSGAYIAGGVIAACGFWLGCCLIPCMVDDCKDSVHFCTRCGSNLGSKRFLFD
ncbi:LITAF-like zinc ribbon domain protein (macronuclear) [Tetrahymena thermophila SB210]|uniref:LITAF-like zinc ribbon domain protein n=1 Tax=Tetrahymena thermophila (strain SB210) TaxID=312017 RepID=I7LW11_TETTS|nr:LITAF-like zinc ribbon domain protein [Tetrahymena thermophila SB210]EAS00550.3 LITAF-like zinc ribbon domain protein [Tetrahymena thermophila SB210]|eukprot:XP_001020795.3 LITAF-like zinc ribbon domain protein [Tetrahymena thermophila SB210]